jgi:hypothetical protein
VCASPASVDGAAPGCPEAAAAPNVCLPPYWATTLAGGGTVGEASSGQSSGSTEPTARDIDAATAPGTPPSASGSGASTGGGDSAKGGCQMVVGTSAWGTLSSGWMAVAMLALGLRRRRAR